MNLFKLAAVADQIDLDVLKKALDLDIRPNKKGLAFKGVITPYTFAKLLRISDDQAVIAYEKFFQEVTENGRIR